MVTLGWRRAVSELSCLAPRPARALLHRVGTEAGWQTSPENRSFLKSTVFRKSHFECQKIWKWRGLGKQWFGAKQPWVYSPLSSLAAGVGRQHSYHICGKHGEN